MYNYYLVPETNLVKSIDPNCVASSLSKPSNVIAELENIEWIVNKPVEMFTLRQKHSPINFNVT